MDQACASTTGTTTTGPDISGPCDEAEHASDQRCTGAATATDDGDDRGGRRGGDEADDHSGHGGGEDRSGSNSGSDD